MERLETSSELNISIIVPIYNVQNYLVDCLESIVKGISKTEDNKVEVILVNDGSTDNSEKICQEYCDKYAYMKYIYQENKGISGARNTGIRAANGKYLLFVDSDDFINSDVFLEIVALADKNYDVVFLTAIKYFPNGQLEDYGEIYLKEDIVGKEKSEVLNKFVVRFNKFPGSVWNKMVNRKLVIENELFFEEGIYVAEDLEWCIKLFEVSQYFYLVEGNYYYYRQDRDGSLSNKINIKSINSLIYLLEKYLSYSFSYNIKESIYSFLSYEYVVLLYLLNRYEGDELNQLYKKIYQLRNVLLKSKNIKYTIIYIIVTVLGVKLSSFLLRLIK